MLIPHTFIKHLPSYTVHTDKYLISVVIFQNVFFLVAHINKKIFTLYNATKH